MQLSPRNLRASGRACVLAATAVALLAGPVAAVAGASSNAVMNLYASPTGSGGACSQALPCSISTAATTAASGSTINLADGTYTTGSQLTFTQSNLTIKGAAASHEPAVVLRPSSPLTNNEVRANPGMTPMEAIIGVSPGSTNVKILNLTIDGSQAAFDCGQEWAGVMYHNATGLVQHVHIQNTIPSAGITGCQAGDAIYVGTDGPSSTVSIVSDLIDTYNKNGITCNEVGTTCTVRATTVHGTATTAIAQNGIQFGFGGGGSITGSTVDHNTYTGTGCPGAGCAAGILLYDSADGVTVTTSKANSNDNNIYAINDGNVVGQETKSVSITKSKATNSTFFDGITLDSVDLANVKKNALTGNTEFGLGIYGATNATVGASTFANTVNANTQAGIYIAGPGSASSQAHDNVISFNIVKSNAGPGIFADTGSFHNTIASNAMRYNSPDAKDTTTGGAGSPPPFDNTWSGNSCITSSPTSGLC